MNICDQIELSFRRIDSKIDTLINSISELTYLNNRSVNSPHEYLNQHRKELTTRVDKSLKQILTRLDQNYKNHILVETNLNEYSNQKNMIRNALTNQCSLIGFNPSEINLNYFDFQHVIYANDFDLDSKFKYVDFQNLDLIRLDDLFANRSNVFIYPLAKRKLFVHYKSTNVVQVLKIKSNHTNLIQYRQTAVLHTLNLSENYYCKFYIYNSKIIANLQDDKQSVLNVYNSNLSLINTKFCTERINIVCINENEIVYWSYGTGYVILNMNSLSQSSENINLSTNDQLLHVSSKRLFYLGYGLGNNPVINLFDRETHEFINFVLVNCSSSYCFKFDDFSRIYVKTNDSPKSICCYDLNGVFLFKCSSHLFEPYAKFDFIDKTTIYFIDFMNQNNIILF